MRADLSDAMATAGDRVVTPRVVIAAPSSGSGQTTVATGLMAALVARGRRVAPFKVGPDHVDPGRNLDPVLVGEERIAPLFAHGASGADVAVIEGSLGLFDGRRGTVGFGSTAHVARLLDAPVVLVVDGRGQGRSLAALLHGFRGYEPTVRLAAVLLNQVGSARHEEVLREACAEIGLPVLGAVPQDAVAAMITRSVDLDAVCRLAATAGSRTPTAWSPADEIRAAALIDSGGESDDHSGPVVAVAGGAAFACGYAEHVELLAAAGAQVAVFDPLRDEALPDGTAALVLPDGCPEQHASALSENTKLRLSVAEFARSGGLVQAEGGGLLYLIDRLSGAPMCGVLPATAELDTLVVGYRDAVAATDSAGHRTGERRTGHEFHRTHMITAASDFGPAWHWRDHDGQPVRDGFANHHIHASYLHTHPAGSPETVLRLVRAAAGVASLPARNH
jgi:cobyrinic acid a,c-diamide synthase